MPAAVLRTFRASRPILLVFAVALVLAAEEPNEDKENLAGIWSVVGFDRSGKEVEGYQEHEIKVVFEGDKWSLHSKVAPTFEGTYKLDPAAKPKTIDLTLKDKSQLGIYELEDDDLRICYAEPGGSRPTEFKTTQEAGEVLVVYKRLKK